MGFHQAFLVDEEETKRTVPDRVLIKRLLKYMARYKSNFATIISLLLVSSSLGLVGPYILAVAIDQYIAQGNLSALYWISAVYVGVYVIVWVVSSFQTYLRFWLGQRLILDLRMDLFSRLQRLSMSFYDKRHVGRIMSRVTNDVETLNEFLTSGVEVAIGDIFILVGIVVMMLILNVQLAMVTLTVIPILLVGTILLGERVREAYRLTRKKISGVTANLAESISGMRVVQSFSREMANAQQFDRVNVENLQANIQAARVSALFFPVVDVLGSVGMCLVLWFGGTSVMNGSLTLGVLVAFMAYVTRFFMPIREISMLYNNVQSALAATERITEILDARSEVEEAKDAVELPKIRGEIKFNDVSFGYDPENSVLDDIELEIRENQRIALVGPTGAGKTSLASLVARFYDPQKGSITVDGYDVRRVTLKSLRSQMGIVLQDPLLFSGTIRENIAYGRPETSEQKIVEAAKAVGAHDFIMNFAQGYDTVVGERGIRLSMGQRQLVSFARALLADPRILILDEATSSVDAYTELLIQNALKKLLEKRTTLIIAHRLSTVRSADRIVVVDNGRIVDMGSHEELMRREGLYRKLYEMQLKPIEAK
ncbi:MAG TPA: ABC transporter ATP-binding protein [Candidatus Bathyarchaeia archaeon]|nr:ABC transporter ATP-binding protein [Candidatus Bathyarchaeia archaeon]